MPPPPASLPDIVDTAIAAGSFNTLVSLVDAAGLVDTLRGPGPFTVFAPNDAAFPQGAALDEFVADTDMETLTSILTYHVVPGLYRSSDLADGQTYITVEGNLLEVSVEEGTGTVEIDDAEVIVADIETSNGIIHVINGVLVP